MTSAILTAGQARINELRGLEQPLVIDKMVFALIPGLDSTVAVDRSMAMPSAEQIVYETVIDADKKGYVGNDQVVYSVILGSDVGDWSFNMIGLVEAVTGNLIAVSTMPETPKTATDLSNNTTGNMITRNFVLAFVDAQNLTGITVSAETWQFDYLADFNGHSEKVVDPSQSGIEKKHVTDGQAKKWEDHAEEPHDFLPTDDYLNTGSAGSTDPDVNTAHTFVTKHAHCPDSTSYFYVMSISLGNASTSNRTQVAFPYTGGVPHWRRRYNNTWSDWAKIGDLSGTNSGGSWAVPNLDLSGTQPCIRFSDEQDGFQSLIGVNSEHFFVMQRRGTGAYDNPSPFYVDMADPLQARGFLSGGEIYHSKNKPDSALKAPSGYLTLSSGMILQWGVVSSQGVTTDCLFPITFPNAVFSVVASAYDTTAEGMYDERILKTMAVSGATFHTYNTVANMTYFAIGY